MSLHFQELLPYGASCPRERFSHRLVADAQPLGYFGGGEVVVFDEPEHRALAFAHLAHHYLFDMPERVVALSVFSHMAVSRIKHVRVNLHWLTHLMPPVSINRSIFHSGDGKGLSMAGALDIVAAHPQAAKRVLHGIFCLLAASKYAACVAAQSLLHLLP